MPEIKKTDLQEIKKPNIENYRNIKPERGTTGNEARAYSDRKFKSLREVGHTSAPEGKTERTHQNDSGNHGAEHKSAPEGKTERTHQNDSGNHGTEHKSTPEEKTERTYFDDKGKLYRNGDNLMPNCTFERNGYEYKTDDHGRTISAGGKLRLREPGPRGNMESMEAIGKGDQKEGDQRGHLIGSQFDGSGGIENMTPMADKVNQSDYKKIETILAKALKDGAEVTLIIEPKYEGDSHRPSEYRVSYTINGERTTVVLRNERKE